MSLEIGLVAAALVVFAGVAGTVTVLSRLSHSRTVGGLGGLAPAARANLLLAWAALLLLAGLMAVVLVLTPSFAHALGLAREQARVDRVAPP